MHVKGTAAAFVRAIADGLGDELFCFGPRGERKTSSAFVGMIAHARRHLAAGFELPVMWMGVTDTFAAHKLKTVRSLQAPHWGGGWRFFDDYHVAKFFVQGAPWVHLDLFGVEDQGAIDRLRMECHNVWFDEPAPAAVLVSSSGISDTAWGTALTSRRLPSHAHVGVVTSNYPDEDHWTWKRAVIDAPAGVLCFRIKPGENASEADRDEWARALKDRPDLLRRLVEGQPGIVLPGAQVAEGFNHDVHVSPDRLRLIDGEPVTLGQDFGHTPATIIGQPWRGEIRVVAALPCDYGGIRQHVEHSVIPWFERNAPWVLKNTRLSINGVYDPAGNAAEQTDIEQSPIRILEKVLGGRWTPGATSWEGRKNPMLQSLHRHVKPGQAALRIDPVDAKPLIQALSGRWYYKRDRLGGVSRDIPAKPNHPWEDLGDSYCYFCQGVVSVKAEKQPLTVETAFRPDRPDRVDELTVEF